MCIRDSFATSAACWLTAGAAHHTVMSTAVSVDVFRDFAEMALMQTAITQPAMLTMDTALYKLLAEYGFAPDMVMGHSCLLYTSRCV